MELKGRNLRVDVKRDGASILQQVLRWLGFAIAGE